MIEWKFLDDHQIIRSERIFTANLNGDRGQMPVRNRIKKNILVHNKSI